MRALAEALVGGDWKIVEVDGHQAVSLGVWQRAQQKRVDGAEDGGVGADAERESQDGGEGESGGAGQQAQAEAKVLDEGFEAGKAPALAALLAKAAGIAEAAQREGAGFLGTPALGDEIGGEQLDVLLHFGVELGIEPRALRAEAQLAKQVHFSTSPIGRNGQPLRKRRHKRLMRFQARERLRQWSG